MTSLIQDFECVGPEETATEHHALTADVQRSTVLAYMLAHVGVEMTRREITAQTHIENTSARIGELKAQGWDISGADTLPLRNRSQLYRLNSTEQGVPKVKEVGITITMTNGVLEVRIHQGCTLPEDQLETLQAKIEECVAEHLGLDQAHTSQYQSDLCNLEDY